MKKFLRRASDRYSKLGLRRKSKQKWRKPKGRDNKMREKQKGYPAVVSIGYRKEKTQRGIIDEKQPVQIFKQEQLDNLEKNQIAVIGKVGKKRRLEIAEKAKQKNIPIQNLNPKRFLNKEKAEIEKKKKQDVKKATKKTAEKSEKNSEEKKEEKEKASEKTQEKENKTKYKDDQKKESNKEDAKEKQESKK